MKKLYKNLIEGKVITAFAFCYLVMFFLTAINKLIFFAIGRGDVFYTVFSFLSTDLGVTNETIKALMSYLMFLGSFYGAIVWPLIYLIMMSFYAAFIQFILHIFLKNPKRFSITLSIFYATIAFLYILTIVPYVGSIAFIILFMFIAGKHLAAKNSFSTAKGVVLMFTPGVLILFASIGFFISVFKMVSLF